MSSITRLLMEMDGKDNTKTESNMNGQNENKPKL